jgi:ABC-type uncharacterized transport system permease subunit
MHIFELIKNAAGEENRYKANLLGGVLALLMLYSLQFIFFDVISAFVVTDEISANGLLIFFMSYALGGLLVSFFSSAIAGFFRQLTQGRVDVLLVRPVNLFVLILFRWCQVYYLLVVFLLLFFFVASGKINFSPFFDSGVNTLMYMVSLWVGVLASIAFILALSSFSFITQRDLPVDYIHSSVFTFALLPSTFYSKAVLYLFIATLPMIVFASVALDALYNGVTPFVLIFIFSAMVGFCLAIKVVLGLFNRFDSVGG